jgi:hypothetical protein
LRAYAAPQALTESAVAEAAILEFVDHRPVDELALLRGFQDQEKVSPLVAQLPS